MNRGRQAGSIGIFIVIGAIFVVSALAVLYGARHFSSQQQETPVVSGELIAANNDKESDRSASQSTDSSRQPQKNETEKNNSQPARSNDQPKIDTRQESAQAGGREDKGLPQTGPTDSLAAAVIFSGLTVATLVYVRSRQLI